VAETLNQTILDKDQLESILQQAQEDNSFLKEGNQSLRVSLSDLARTKDELLVQLQQFKEKATIPSRHFSNDLTLYETEIARLKYQLEITLRANEEYKSVCQQLTTQIESSKNIKREGNGYITEKEYLDLEAYVLQDIMDQNEKGANDVQSLHSYYKAIAEANKAMKQQLESKDNTIKLLQARVTTLETLSTEHEQHVRSLVEEHGSVCKDNQMLQTKLVNLEILQIRPLQERITLLEGLLDEEKWKLSESMKENSNLILSAAKDIQDKSTSVQHMTNIVAKMKQCLLLLADDSLTVVQIRAKVLDILGNDDIVVDIATKLYEMPIPYFLDKETQASYEDPRITQLYDTLRSVTEELSSIKSRYDTCSMELDQCNKSQTDYLNRLHLQEATIQDLQTSLDRATKESSQLSETLQAVKSQLHTKEQEHIADKMEWQAINENLKEECDKLQQTSQSNETEEILRLVKQDILEYMQHIQHIQQEHVDLQLLFDMLKSQLVYLYPTVDKRLQR
jgi:chromosome segregation ATPase